ncbi:MAG: putative metal-binding motif-containing protein [Deltaproteobacteria bacterium]|nr:putative metal-binding motif-containing protein [Deltaproteobacteria bacterium]
MNTRYFFFLTIALAVGCGDDASDGMDGDGGTSCESDEDCTDGLFCNGEEACEAGRCTTGLLPCAGADCLESSRTCEDTGCVDADGDGRRDIACGGDDCDDSNPERFPGNTEICDVEGVDEDCDPVTFGFRDGDGDGSPDARCCNGDNCGLDCDDSMPGTNPSVPEVCGDAIDNDCDGSVDEGVVRTCYEDADGDGFAASDAATMNDCSCPAGWTETEPSAGTTDCNDDPGSSGGDFYPGASEVCDGFANGCPEADALTPVEAEDADGDGHSAPDAACTGGFPKDDCMDDHESVFTGQTTYFDVPWCPRSIEGGRIIRITGRFWLCATDAAVPSFDYDCSGTVDPTPSFDRCQNASGAAVCFVDGAPDQCLGTGPTDPPDTEDCGDPLEHTVCECTEGSGALGTDTCTGSTETRTLLCR